MKTSMTTLTVLIAAALMVGLSCPASAAVSGTCVNCHTMHNSQDNATMNFDESTTTPIGALLRGDCVGCHSDPAADKYKQTTSNAPVVYNTGGSILYGYDDGTNRHGLAAGNFHYCDDQASSVYGHNVQQISTQDDSNLDDQGPPGFKAITAPPTGFSEGATNWGPASWTGSQQAGSGATTKLTCAGEFGCHGNRSTGYGDYEGIRGAHHGDDSTIDGSTVAASYRFLAGIMGAELNTANYEWEYQADSTNHNGYLGASAYNDDNTISFLCGECHGNFHAHSDLGGTGEVGSSSSWLRHPTDIALTASGGSSFTTDYTTYSVETPVAYTSPATSTSAVNSSSIVMCLSCHRAHSSPYADILRFSYSAMNAGDSTNDSGCERCHQRQR